MYYYTPLPLNLANNQQQQQRHHIYYYTPLPLNLANKQASKQQASNKHFSFPFWPMLGLIAPGSTLF